MVLILIKKDVFEPSSKDLKFMVQNFNYICTNLIETERRKWLDSRLGATRHFTLELNDLSSLCVPGSKLQEGYDSLGCC